MSRYVSVGKPRHDVRVFKTSEQCDSLICATVIDSGGPTRAMCSEKLVLHTSQQESELQMHLQVSETIKSTAYQIPPRQALGLSISGSSRSLSTRLPGRSLFLRFCPRPSPFHPRSHTNTKHFTASFTFLSFPSTPLISSQPRPTPPTSPPSQPSPSTTPPTKQATPLSPPPQQTRPANKSAPPPP